jgi:hypothetical protein
VIDREEIERRWQSGGMSRAEYEAALGAEAAPDRRELPPLPEDATGPERVRLQGGAQFNLEAKP